VDALFVARRMIESAWALANGKLLLLMLDWSKAFDKVKPSGLVYALQRFGLPEAFVDMVLSIYTGRSFCVRDGKANSSSHGQESGISQGCPLSPFLFVILMTVLLKDVEDVVDSLHGSKATADYIPSRDLLYADDTLGAETEEAVLQTFLDQVVAHGHAYGLELNWDKTIVLAVRHPGELKRPDGQAVVKEEQAIYLGGLLAQDGNPATELTRRIGEARASFDAVARVWKHANISRPRKLEIYRACIIPKLMYGLETVWLRKAEQERLNAFHCRCLRKVLGIPHSYVSRVSNAEVLRQAGEQPILYTLLARQLRLYGRVARLPGDSLQRLACLTAGGVEPASWKGKRSRGRPRQAWAPEVYQHAVKAAGGVGEVQRAMCESEAAWADTVRRYIGCLGREDGNSTVRKSQQEWHGVHIEDPRSRLPDGRLREAEEGDGM